MWTLDEYPAAAAVRVDDAEPDVVDVAGRVLGELDAVLAPWFARVGTRLAAQQYVRGLASLVERKNSWQLAEHAGHATPDRLQRLLASAAWDEAGVREDVRDWTVGFLADPQAVLVADDTGFLKKGRRSAGVQRQYSGTAGRIDNCQIGVFLAYAAPAGRALIDAELYLPASWTDDRRRCAAAGVPDEVGFATKPELARVMIERVVKAGLPFGWVTADEFYGDNPALRAWLEGQQVRYVMAVSRDHPVPTAASGTVRADALAADTAQTRSVAGSRRLRRWDVGQATLVLLGMATFVAIVYVTVVRGGGVLIGRTDSPSLALSVLATAIVALGFQPVARRLRPIAARLARRERAAPYEVLARFRTEVGGGYGTDELPGRMAKLLAEATRTRYAQVWLAAGDTLTLAATWPTDAATSDAPPPDPVNPAQSVPGRRELPIRHADELLGVLVVQENDRQPLTPVENQLFAGLAAQAGLVLRTLRLRTGLANRLAESARRAADLRASRERIVAAQDDERRRLERNIHDGAQQHLVALAVNLRLARTLAAKSPARMRPMLDELRAAAAETIDTLRDLSRGIYPRRLTESGLQSALEAAVAAGSMPVELSIDPMERPRHDIEVALYFCCIEALQNAAKHSGATRVAVRVSRLGDSVEMTVSDDGHGFSLPAAGSGRGLLNMRDRAEAVGGSLHVDSRLGHGTVIGIRVPFASASQGGG